MKHISKWLESIFVRKPIDVEMYKRPTPLPKTMKTDVKEEFGNYEHTPTLPVLTSLHETSFEFIEAPGFDPYNSGSFETSKSRRTK